MERTDFDTFFSKATGGIEPFDHQRRLACGERAGRSDCRSLSINIPTGCGKTAAVVLAWLWNRVALQRPDWPRRLVYCLPMRVLVEQTRDNAVLWLHNLGLLGGTAEFVNQGGRKRLRSYTPDLTDSGKVTVHILMGGEDEDEWDLYPEREAIVIGTQDMLLSRALNRGYAASRARWPMHFGLLNTDCLWVFDEVQLMGPGLATTAQLEAFRWLLGSKDGHRCRSIWMSATLQRDWLKTVDFRERVDGLSSFELHENDFKNKDVDKRWKAQKRLNKAQALIGDARSLASEILNAHKPGTRTIVVVNTVRRACELFEALRIPVDPGKAKGKGRKGKKTGPREPATPEGANEPALVLLHSRFRPGDRANAMAAALADPAPGGTIVVSTQVIEAGVDVSATTLFTELAPWASLVQRFGRCNRRGHDPQAHVLWIDLPGKDADAADVARPYELEQLKKARELLVKKCENGVGPGALDEVRTANQNEFSKAMDFQHGQVIRVHELIDLFPTEPDLAGGFTDISPFVRDPDPDVDVRVFWRSMPDQHPQADSPGPSRDELCAVPCRELQEFLGKAEAWEWDDDAERWQSRRAADIRSGMTLMLAEALGGYESEKGWTGKPGHVTVLEPDDGEAPDGLTDDRRSLGPHWQTIEAHTARVEKRVRALAEALPVDETLRNALVTAGRWHDVGKGHRKWQSAWRAFTNRLCAALTEQDLLSISGLNGLRNTLQNPPGETALVAKFPSAWDVSPSDLQNGEREVITDLRRRFQFRPGLRHEAASALAAMDAWRSGEAGLSALAIYLVAAHHGKVRTVLRSRAANGFDAFGVYDGDHLPAVVPLPASGVRLSTAAKAIGAVGDWTEDGSFEVVSPSWVEMVAALLGPLPGDPDTSDLLVGMDEPRALGPFTLAFLEAALCAADRRADEEVVS